MIDDQDRCEWVNVYLYRLIWVVPYKIQRAIKRFCVRSLLTYLLTCKKMNIMQL